MCVIKTIGIEIHQFINISVYYQAIVIIIISDLAQTTEYF